MYKSLYIVHWCILYIHLGNIVYINLFLVPQDKSTFYQQPKYHGNEQPTFSILKCIKVGLLSTKHVYFIFKCFVDTVIRINVWFRI